MKISSLLLLAGFLFLPAQLLTSEETSFALGPPPTLSNPANGQPDFLNKSGIRIISATYGSGVNFSDVTEETVKLLNQQPRLFAAPDWLKADPTPGWNKALVIVFQYQGRRCLFSSGEGGQVDIPLLKLKAAEQEVAATR